MESKTGPLKKKTKSQIERDIPIIKPEDCPGAVIRYFNKVRDADYLVIREIMQEELAPVKRFMKIAASNQIWLVGISVAMAIIGIVLWAHLV